MIRLGEKKLVINNEGDFPLYFLGKLGSGEQALYEGNADPVAGRYQLEEDGSAGAEAGDTDTFDPDNASSTGLSAAAKLKIVGLGEIYKPNILNVIKTVPYKGAKKIQHIVLSLNSGSAPLVGSEIAFRITMKSNKLQTEYITFFNDGKVYQFRTIQVQSGDTLAILATRLKDTINNLQMGSGNANPLFKLVASQPDASMVTNAVIQLESPASDIDFVVEVYDVTTSRYAGLSVDVSNVKVTIPTTIPGFLTAPAIASYIPAAVEPTRTLAVTVNSAAFTLSGAPTVALTKGMLVSYTTGGKVYYAVIDTVGGGGVTGTFTSVQPITASAATAVTTGYGSTDYNEGTFNFDYMKTQVFQTEGNAYPYADLVSAENRQVPIGKNSLYTSYIINYKVIRPDLNNAGSLNGQQVGYFAMHLVFNTSCTTSIAKLDAWLSTADLDSKRILSNEVNRNGVNITTGTFTGSPFIQ